MLNDITLCHGEGNLGRVCARRQHCQRYIELSHPHPTHVAQAALLCRPNVMMIGEQSYAAENAYRFFIPVREA